MKVYKTLLFLACGLSHMVIGQSNGTPGFTNDAHWNLEQSKSDEFNFLDLNKWTPQDHFDQYGTQPGNKFWVALDDNVSVSNGKLILDIKTEVYGCPQPGMGCDIQDNTGLPYDYTTGYVRSNFSIGYGYVEARVKVPKVVGMNSAFWLHAGAEATNNYREVDIFEDFYLTSFGAPNNIPGFPNGQYPGNTVHGHYISTSNIHHITGVVNPSNGINGFWMEVNDYSEWHIYGLEYTSEKLIWFIDGVKVREEVNPAITGELDVLFNIGSYSLSEQIPPGQSKSMEVEYFRYYSLDQNCAVINVPTYNFALHDNHIKQSIKIGNATTTNIAGKNSVVNLRAKDFIQIDGVFNVPIGAQFTMYPNDCN